MQSRPVCVYGVLYFLCTVGLKLYILGNLYFSADISGVYILFFPLFFRQDLFVTALILLSCDYGLLWIKILHNRPLAGMLSFLIRTLYTLTLLIMFITVKFYSLVGTFLTGSFLKYGDQISNFRRVILHEVDLFFYFLAAGALVIAFFSHWLYRFLNNRRNRERRHLRRSRLMLPAAVCIIYGLFSFFIPKLVFPAQNLYALDRNPVLELVVSFFAFPQLQEQSGEVAGISTEEDPVGYNNPGKVESVSEEAEGAAPLAATADSPARPDTPQLYTGQTDFPAYSLVHPQESVPAALAAYYPGNLAEDFNIIIYKFESTCGNYLGSLNPAFRSYTENLSALADRGLLLANHYTQEPASLKSMYSILSGKYSYKTRNWGEYVRRSRKDTFLGEIFASHGYQTYFLGTGNGRIYLQNEMLRGKFGELIDRKVLERQGTSYADCGLFLDDRVLLEYFEDYLRGPGERFFFFFCPVSPHHPYDVPADQFRLYPEGTNLDLYKNSLYYADWILGRIYGLLEEYQQVNNTILIIVSDHGEAFFQHPRNYIHSIYLYEENVSTFCIFSNPLLFGSQVYRSITRHVDIAASLLDLLGIQPEGDLDGTSIFQSRQARYAPFYTGFSDPYLGLRDDKWKYIINRMYDSQELYDLSLDPGEKNNLATAFPELCGSFKIELLGLEQYINRP